MTMVMSEPEQISAAWLTDAFEESGVARGAQVIDVEFLGWIGTGQTGRNGRFALTWDDPSRRPASIVGKFPSADANARMAAFANGTYIKEWLFYDRIASTVDIRTPRCHIARFDQSVPDFVLIMEDLADSEQGDQLEGLTTDRISTAIEQLVGLHAPRFGDPTLETFLNTDTPTPSVEEAGALLEMMYGLMVPGFLDRLGDRLDPDVAKLTTDFAPHVSQWIQGTDTPPTVIHLDYRADNLLFGTTPEAPDLVVVDWQTLSAGLGANDLAYLISGSFPDATDRASAERDLVDEYRDRMAAAGVVLSADAMWRDYRVGSLWGMIITVIATMAAAQTERGDDMLTAMAQRHGRHALDLEALTLVS